ncbi:MAG: hypothetical protein OCD02_13465 [Spirochaetaceae bacterium]
MNNFNLAIITYLEDKDPITLDSFISSPSQVLESQYISKDHFVYSEAIIILDSLNAYNKGLSNSDNEERLLEINDQSPFYSWRCATLAIKEFYNGNQFLVKEYLNDIRVESPVLKIRDFILLGRNHSLIIPDKHLNSSVDALREVIDNSLIDMYEVTVKLLLDDLKGLNTTDLHNILITIIEESLDIIPLTMIHKSLIKSVEMMETLRLMALGTIFKHPIISLQYLFSYISINNFSSNQDPKLTALLIIISDISKALKIEKYKFVSTKSKKQFSTNSTLFIQGLSELFILDFKESKDPLTNLIRAMKIPSPKVENIEYSNDIFQGELF